jgi:hypothetical protein
MAATRFHKAAARCHRNAEPLVAALAVSHARRRPAAILLAEIVGDIGDIDAFFREQMRQRIKPPPCRALSGVGSHRRFGLDVIERFIGDVDLDAGRLLKASTIFMKATSSASTNRFHRSMLILAPASGFHGAVCAQALAWPSI